MATILVIISFIIGIAVGGATDSFFLGVLGFFLPMILLWCFVGLLNKGEKNDKQREIQKRETNIEKGKSIISDKFSDVLGSAPLSPSQYNIVTIRDTTLKLYLGKFKVWKNGDMIHFLAFDDNELREGIGSGKYKTRISNSFESLLCVSHISFGYIHKSFVNQIFDYLTARVFAYTTVICNVWNGIITLSTLVLPADEETVNHKFHRC